MKKVFFSIYLIVISIHLVNAQNEINFKNDSVKQFIDKSYTIIYENALNRDHINWETLKDDIYLRTKNAETIEEILSVYPYIFEKIDDHHGFLNFKGKTYKWKGDTKITPNKEVENSLTKYPKAYSMLIHENIGYLRIPGNNDFNTLKMDSIASNIVDEIDKINTKKIKGWILDLRLNTGGNMYPMISGITDIIGDNGKIGGFISFDNKPNGEWIIKNGNLYVDSIQVINRKKLKTPIKKGLPVVVITSSYTASSGEMTALTLIGKKKTTLIGEPTAGYTSVNLGFNINKDAGLTLAIDFAADCNGKIYPKNIAPNIEIIGGDNFDNLLSDKKIIEAVRLIK